MKAKTLMTVVLASAVWTSPAAQPQKERCGTRQPSLEEVAQIEQRIARARKSKALVTIPVWVHVITRGAGFANGELSEDAIRSRFACSTIRSPGGRAAPAPASTFNWPA